MAALSARNYPAERAMVLPFGFASFLQRETLEFVVNTLGLKVINLTGGVKRLIKSIADKYPPDQCPEIAKYASYIDFYGLDSEYDYDLFWAKVVELGIPVTTHYGS